MMMLRGVRERERETGVSKVGGVGFDKKYIDLQTQEQVFFIQQKITNQATFNREGIEREQKKITCQDYRGSD